MKDDCSSITVSDFFLKIEYGSRLYLASNNVIYKTIAALVGGVRKSYETIP